MTRAPKRKPKTASRTKVAVVTGGGSGLGRDIANRLVRDGYRVAILGRRTARLKPKRGERDLYPYTCDIADRQQVRATVKAIRADLGRIDLLVNNAGILRRATHDEITPEAIEEQFGTNLIGMMQMCLASIPALKKTCGNIVQYQFDAQRSLLTAVWRLRGIEGRDECVIEDAGDGAWRGGIFG